MVRSLCIRCAQIWSHNDCKWAMDIVSEKEYVTFGLTLLLTFHSGWGLPSRQQFYGEKNIATKCVCICILVTAWGNIFRGILKQSFLLIFFSFVARGTWCYWCDLKIPQTEWGMQGRMQSPSLQSSEDDLSHALLEQDEATEAGT